MQDYLMPSEGEMQLMSQEYDKVLNFTPKIANTRFALTLPIYLVEGLQKVCDNICEVTTLIESLANEDFYMRNKDILQMIINICHSNQRQLLCNYQYLSSYCITQSMKISALRPTLYKIMKLQGQILRELYTIFYQTKIKIFESVYQEQMLACIQMHSICI